MFKKIDDNTIEHNGDFRMSRPQIDKGPNAQFYGYQECSELVAGRWEGFVSVSRTQETHEQRVKLFQNAMAIAERKSNGLNTAAKRI